MPEEPALALDLAAGAAAGFIATAPMTLVMQALHKQLPWYERYALPPRQIVGKLTTAAGLRRQVHEPQHTAITLVAHFGYGAATGALYAPVARALRLPPVLSGVGFGLAVWGVSYLGLLPALGILRPATEHPERRTALMIGAHLVWGATLGLLVGQFRRR
jgi:uncharacterized membrane protein YagU involved in acid resistance